MPSNLYGFRPEIRYGLINRREARRKRQLLPSLFGTPKEARAFCGALFDRESHFVGWGKARREGWRVCRVEVRPDAFYLLEMDEKELIGAGQ
jgi:hypothetical protein